MLNPSSPASSPAMRPWPSPAPRTTSSRPCIPAPRSVRRGGGRGRMRRSVKAQGAAGSSRAGTRVRDAFKLCCAPLLARIRVATPSPHAGFKAKNEKGRLKMKWTVQTRDNGLSLSRPPAGPEAVVIWQISCYMPLYIIT